MSSHRDWTGLEIAVIGMAGRFPGARDLDQLWANLAAGRESISRFADDELRAAGVGEELLAEPSYVKAGAVLDGAPAVKCPAPLSAGPEKRRREAVLGTPRAGLQAILCGRSWFFLSVGSFYQLVSSGEFRWIFLNPNLCHVIAADCAMIPP